MIHQLSVILGTLVFGGVAMWLAYLLGQCKEKRKHAELDTQAVGQGLAAGDAARTLMAERGVLEPDQDCRDCVPALAARPLVDEGHAGNGR